MKKVEAAKWEAQRPADRGEAAHNERMATLEKERYNLVKHLNDLEAAIHKEEVILSQMNDRLALCVAERKMLVANRSSVSPIEARNIVFKEMGISLSGVDLAGKSSKCHIQKRSTNDIISIDIKADTSAFDSANLLWSHLGF